MRLSVILEQMTYTHERAIRAITDLLSPLLAGEKLVIQEVPQGQPGNLAVPLFAYAKKQGQAPRATAEKLAKQLDLQHTLFSQVEAVGTGFLNFTFDPAVFAEQVFADFAREGDHYGRPAASKPERVVIDYSSPNIAKPMHVGHIRSTLIGDALARLYTFLGHHVIRQNHLGDWGTQFGELIEQMIETGVSLEHDVSMEEVETLYQTAKQRFDDDPDFQERARQRVVKLQQGDPDTRHYWEYLYKESLLAFDALYQRLGVLLTDEDLRGESTYNDQLPDTIAELKKKRLLTESDGALCLFLRDYIDPATNQPYRFDAPMIIVKKDGASNYTTTDLATLRFSVTEDKATHLIYVVDVRQSDHFQMLFAAARLAGWLDKARAVHVAFGTILGEDKKPFKTRSGGTVKLVDVLDEAEKRARALVEEKIAARDETMDISEQGELARMIGIGALKYADLMNVRTQDYVFSWERMISFEGNTAPYLQYAVVRINSLLAKAGDQEGVPLPILLVNPHEQALLRGLAQFPDALARAATEYRPNYLTSYLFDLAQTFTAFYDAVPIIKSPSQELKIARLALARFTSQVLSRGLDLLGIEVPKRM